jgi:hypothetical protein
MLALPSKLHQEYEARSSTVTMWWNASMMGLRCLLAAKIHALFPFGVFALRGEVRMLDTAALALPAILPFRERVVEFSRPARVKSGAAL